MPRARSAGTTRHHPTRAGYDYESLTCTNYWRFVGATAARTCGSIRGPRSRRSRPSIRRTTTPTGTATRSTRSRCGRRTAWTTRKLAGLLKHLDRPARTFLDVGCGDGRFLELMAQRGVRARAVLRPRARRRRRRGGALRGFNAFAERVEDATRDPRRPTLDLATMFHVLEHVEDPADVRASARSLARSRGAAGDGDAERRQLGPALFRRTWWGGYHIPRHWNLFSPEGLARLSQDAGLEVVETRFQTGHSFWMWSVHHRLRYGKPRTAARTLVQPLQGLPFSRGFTAFDMVRARLGAQHVGDADRRSQTFVGARERLLVIDGRSPRGGPG